MVPQILGSKDSLNVPAISSARDVDAEIRFDPDQLSIEGCMIDFG
jgi:hypothetical protein